MPSLGTGVFVYRHRSDQIEFLVGLRAMDLSRGPNLWALPGGMVDPGETIARCAQREVFEETGLIVTPASDQELMNCVIGVSDHSPREDHITFWVLTPYRDGQPRVVEPKKCVEWRWVTFEEFKELAIQEGEQAFWAPANVLALAEAHLTIVNYCFE